MRSSLIERQKKERDQLHALFPFGFIVTGDNKPIGECRPKNKGWFYTIFAIPTPSQEDKWGLPLKLGTEQREEGPFEDARRALALLEIEYLKALGPGSGNPPPVRFACH